MTKVGLEADGTPSKLGWLIANQIANRPQAASLPH
jgi:hypothetical protein